MHEEYNFEDARAQRREMAEKSLRPTTDAEALAEIEKIFANNTSHPWYANCTEFLDVHKGEQILRGEQPDHAAFLYHPATDTGLWYRYDGALKGVGVISASGLAALKSIALEKGLVR